VGLLECDHQRWRHPDGAFTALQDQEPVLEGLLLHSLGLLASPELDADR
jgi:hypothetical protein